ATRVRAASASRVTDALLLATAFCVTFEKVHWQVAGAVSLADVLTILFLASFAVQRLGAADWRLERTAVAVLGFFFAFLLVYLAGYFNLETDAAFAQFGKGMIKFALHFGFLLAAVAHLARRSPAFYWRALAFFVAGIAANAGYGILQLLAARAGQNLDQTVLAPLTGGASSINIYGAVNGRSVYRPNALTGDPNHLGIMLIVPLLVLTPLYLRLERGHRLRLPLALLLGFLLLVELATLSRSGLLGLGVGGLILAVPYRRYLVSRALLAPLAGVAVLVGYLLWSRREFFSTVLRSRVDTGGRSTSAHFAVYDFIPQVLQSHPLFGLGLNNFSVYYEFATGKTNWGPHSFYVALLVETGIVGAIVFALFLRFLFKRLRDTRALGRSLGADPLAARVRPLAWGLTAALAGTMAANVFYLTMQFYYFYVFAALCLSAHIVFQRADILAES
ncbi:MAG: O-antigen ligase family protein, partial [Actinomycetota bacterium]|nr:O-antigen ligase family protein [Actinomycetota bacterium]